MKKTIFLFLIGVNGIVSASNYVSDKVGKLCVFIVADTDDYNIGRSVEADVKNMKKSIVTIGNGIGFETDTIVFSGRNCASSDVSYELKHLKTSSKDIIIFYYSGHGYNKGSLNLRWPVLSTRFGDLFGINVIESLRTKKKKSALVLFDCCNSYPGRKKNLDLRSSDKPFFLKKSHKLQSFFKLLLSFKGMVLSAAASPGETATCESSWGGSFSRGFLKAVRHLGADETVSWDKICKLTAHKTTEIAYEVFDSRQYPIYSIEGG